MYLQIYKSNLYGFLFKAYCFFHVLAKSFFKVNFFKNVYVTTLLSIDKKIQCKII